MLDGADLGGAALTAGHFMDVSLRGANLEWADLTLATLHRVALAEARCDNVLFGGTVLAHDVDLADPEGLADSRHLAPSSLDLATLEAAAGRLPGNFVEGVGLADVDASLRRLSGLSSRH
jgi:uncharacterized protein YjbI with pentapeptide repeats